MRVKSGAPAKPPVTGGAVVAAGLLALVREAWGKPYLTAVNSGRFYLWIVIEDAYWRDPSGTPPLLLNQKSEAEALVAALEAAP